VVWLIEDHPSPRRMTIPGSGTNRAHGGQDPSPCWPSKPSSGDQPGGPEWEDDFR